jgi:hypothetical protein
MRLELLDTDQVVSSHRVFVVFQIEATMSAKLPPGGVMGAQDWPAYLSLTYFTKSKTKT